MARPYRPGRRGTEKCGRCRKQKRGVRAPCVLDPALPHGPCVPCRNAGLSAKRCGPRTLPGGKTQSPVKKPLAHWVRDSGAQAMDLDPEELNKSRPGHGLDLQAFISNAGVVMHAPVQLGHQPIALHVNTGAVCQVDTHFASQRYSSVSMERDAAIALTSEALKAFMPSADLATIMTAAIHAVNYVEQENCRLGMNPTKHDQATSAQNMPQDMGNPNIETNGNEFYGIFDWSAI
jgi:hypothetical protein